MDPRRARIASNDAPKTSLTPSLLDLQLLGTPVIAPAPSSPSRPNQAMASSLAPGSTSAPLQRTNSGHKKGGLSMHVKHLEPM